ncbi:hypothetical protein [Reyranella sp.]|jgi:hypothetical protein|uniref:hypothetical protein n=1 Tax=Reyranella sp. TaxID=1929291 RepID=UPI00272270F8|nr:hypothetical protein [Reyranella sp.]MDO8976839.1 hypothetical protein [Reyranella sp.]
MTRHARLRTKEELGLPKWMPAVEGSLDDPPIVLRQDRLKLSLICLGLTVVGGLILLIPVRVYSAWHLIFLGFLGLGIVTGGAMAVRPATLILDPHGLIWRPTFRTFEYPWSAFARFYVLSRPRRFTVVVGEFTHEGPPKPAWRRRLTGRLELGSLWELPPQRVADVLNEARSRWALPAREAQEISIP